MKPVQPETNRPPQNLPYRNVERALLFQHVVPGKGILIGKDVNGNLYFSVEGGMTLLDLVAGENIRIEEVDGKLVISATDTVAEQSGGNSVDISVNPTTGDVNISDITGGNTDPHYKGVFETTRELVAGVQDPETGDYALVRRLTYSDGERTWEASDKYCFYIDGQWTVVDQMLTFTDAEELIKHYYSVGGSSPVIYLATVARTGSFNDLADKPIVATPVISSENNEISMECSTEGSEIFYTLDGSTPYPWGQNAYKYSAPLSSVPPHTVIRAVGVKNGMINSVEALYTVGVDSLLAPEISIDHRTGTVTVENPNLVGSVVMYLDGTPTAYDGPFVITERTEVSAYIDDNNLISSPYTTRVFEKVATPARTMQAFDWALNEGRNVYACATPGAEMHLSTDGTNPDWESPVTAGTVRFDRIYYGADGVLPDVRLMAIAVDMVPSDVLEDDYGLLQPSAPVISFDKDTRKVTIEKGGETVNIPEGMGRILYTTDGSFPEEHGEEYTGPFEVSGVVTVTAVFEAYGTVFGEGVAQLIVVLDPVEFSFDYTTGDLTLENPNGNGDIYYEISGVSEQPELYTGPFSLITGNPVVPPVDVTAYVKSGQFQSPVRVNHYEPAGTPVFDYDERNDINWLSGTCSLHVGSPTPGAELRYETGADPVTYSSDPCPAVLTSNYFDTPDYKVRAFAPGYIPSGIRVYEGESVVPDAPSILADDFDGILTFGLAGNTSDIPLQTNNITPELGARIYYTLDGTDPDAETGILWDGNSPKIALEGIVVKAICVCYGQYQSAVATRSFIVPLYFETASLSAGKDHGTVKIVSGLDEAPDIEISMGGRNSFQKVVFAGTSGNWESETYTLGGVETRTYFRGVNEKLADASVQSVTKFVIGDCTVYGGGTVQSLVDGMGLSPDAINMHHLFAGTPLVSAPELTAYNLTGQCYAHMFDDCQNLVEGPYLQAENLANGCYTGIFQGCFNLTGIPENPFTGYALPAMEIPQEAYAYMFYGCASLVNAPKLPATTLGNRCYANMFLGCYQLSGAPDLPAQQLQLLCYADMFSGTFFNMSDDGTTFNFQCGATLPQTVDGVTYSTDKELATWMGNTNGFN